MIPLSARRVIETALEEDLGLGDVTGSAVVPAGSECRVAVVAREALVVCGAEIAAAVFWRLDADLNVEPALADGADAGPGDRVLYVSGAARPILAAERTALNLLQHLSGIATTTRAYADRLRGTAAAVCDTRKTTPGLRELEKYAVRCGGGRNHRAVDAIVRDGPRLVRELLIDDLQVAFDRDAGGALRFTREASHSRHRIIYAKDHTGRAILTALHRRLAELAAAGTLPGGGSLTVATGCFAVDLLTLSHSSVDFLDRYRPLSCIGAHVLDVAAGEVRPIMAKKTVLATGGLGQVYLHSTNDAGAYGHGVAMAYRVGARVINMEYVQFHPTVFHRRGERPFLISEAVRGEGGVLINQQGEAFMERYHRDGSLAPRDVISRSIHSELLRGASDTVYIDLAGVDADYARRRFPTINARLLAAGVDMTREPIPVVPAAHYSCGGIHTDMAGDTNIAHLSAIGETACTGLHGANRLASTTAPRWPTAS